MTFIHLHRRTLPALALAAALAACGGGGGADAPARAQPAQARARPLAGVAYYVDSISGNDANPGTMALPFQSFARLRTVTLGAHDSVLLVQGGVWRDSLDLAGASDNSSTNVTIGSYAGSHGTARPQIFGASLGAGLAWTPAGTGWAAKVYTTNIAGTVRELYWKGDRLTRARQPNVGGTTAYDLLQSATDVGGGCSLLGLAPPWSGYSMANTNIVARVVPWQLTAAALTTTSGNFTACLDTQGFKPQVGEGYYLEAEPQTAAAVAQKLLDSAGEWWQDGSTHDVYVWFPGDANPNPTPKKLEYASSVGGDVDNGLVLRHLPNASVSGIDFDMQVAAGVDLKASGGTQVSDIGSSRAGTYGVFIEVGNDGSSLTNSRISGAGVDGVKMSGLSIHVSGNTIADTGLAGSAVATLGGGAGILVSGSGVVPTGAVISGNRITRPAYVGMSITPWLGGSVTSNVVLQPCQLLSDCAGIYAPGAPPAGSTGYGSGTITGNVVSSVVANVDGTVAGQYSRTTVAGIYLDENAGRFDIEGNSISNVGAPDDIGAGIFLHKSANNLLKGNTVWLASRASLRFQSQYLVSGSSTVYDVHDNTVVDNRLYSGKVFTSPGAASAPVAHTTYAQEWDRPASAALAFSTDGNVVGHGTAGGANTTWTLGDRHGVTWLAESTTPLSDSLMVDSEWDTLTSSADGVAVLPNGPLRQLGVTGAGTELVPDANMANVPGTWSWTPAGEGNFTGCGSNCVQWSPSMSGSKMQSGAFTAPAGLVYFEFHGKASAGFSRMDVSFPGGAPLPLVWQTVVPSYEDAYLQYIAAPAAGGPAQVQFSSVHAPQTFAMTGASLKPITGYSTMQPQQEGVLLVNTTASPLAVACSGTGLRNCASLIDSTGAAVVLSAGAITVPANSSLLVLVADTAWTR